MWERAPEERLAYPLRAPVPPKTVAPANAYIIVGMRHSGRNSVEVPLILPSAAGGRNQVLKIRQAARGQPSASSGQLLNQDGEHALYFYSLL